LKEKFLLSYVLDRFQSSSEDLNMYIMSVVAAADILGFSGSDSHLFHRLLQNMHPESSPICCLQTSRSLCSIYIPLLRQKGKQWRLRISVSYPLPLRDRLVCRGSL
jgi:hypothetical protein